MSLEFLRGDFVQIVATAVVAYEVYRVARETKTQREQTSKLETLNALAAYHEDVRAFREWMRRGNNTEKLKEPDDLPAQDRDIITRYLTVCERLAVGVRQEVYSFQVVKSAVSKSLRTHFIQLRPYIEARRVYANSDWVYEQFEWLCFELEGTSPDPRLPKDWKISEAAQRQP